MSGIAGAYQQADGASLTRRMSSRPAQRSPNSSRLYSFEQEEVAAHLAHYRSGVADIHGGSQPLVKESLALSYNGSLYNYRELRTELTTRGVSFLTSGDTEVVLEAWRLWGPACLRRFRGMFAFALFEERTRSLYLARDQFGIQSLHYLRREDGVVFASELNALVAAFGEELTIDPGALVASMLYSWVPEGRCSISKVEKLAPGTWARFHPDGTHQIGRYWDIAEVAAAAAAGPPVDLREVVEASVAAHVVLGGPVATLWSGSLDSSIVTALAQRHLQAIDAYTVSFRSKGRREVAGSSEGVANARMVDRFGIQFKRIEVVPDAVDLLSRNVAILDEPMSDPSTIGNWLTCEAARQAGTSVVLSGIGAAELFGGHPRHVACLLSGRYQRLPSSARDAVSSMVANLPLTAAGHGLRHVRWAKRFLTFSEFPEEAAFRRSYSLYDPVELLGMVGPDLGGHVDDLVGEHLEMYWDNQLSDPVSRMCLADARHSLPGLGLAHTNRISMAASTEVRLPFVDPVVFRAAFSLAGDQKVRGRRGQIALTEAARAWVPGEIASQPKGCATVPLRSWVMRDLRELIDDVLVSGLLVASGFLKRDALTHLVAEQRSGREDRSKHIWHLLTLELWIRAARAAGVGL